MTIAVVGTLVVVSSKVVLTAASKSSDFLAEKMSVYFRVKKFSFFILPDMVVSGISCDGDDVRVAAFS